jgi:hypothetical protein
MRCSTASTRASEQREAGRLTLIIDRPLRVPLILTRCSHEFHALVAKILKVEEQLPGRSPKATTWSQSR